MKYYFFLDETGDHGLKYVDKNFPVFVLCGCLFNEKDLTTSEKQINKFKIKYFNTEKVILHSREIRKCEGTFQVLFNPDLKKTFYSDLNEILESSSYTIIASAIDKEKHIKQYGKSAHDPYCICLSFILERLVFLLNRIDKSSSVELCIEKRGKKEDNILLSHFNSIMDLGTNYVKPDEIKNKIKGLKFSWKADNIIGLQIADLCAYPLARYIINPEVPYIPFEIIKGKIHSDKKGIFSGWGLKCFP
jgi:hypothetical protein